MIRYYEEMLTFRFLERKLGETHMSPQPWVTFHMQSAIPLQGIAHPISKSLITSSLKVVELRREKLSAKVSVAEDALSRLAPAQYKVRIIASCDWFLNVCKIR